MVLIYFTLIQCNKIMVLIYFTLIQCNRCTRRCSFWSTCTLTLSIHPSIYGKVAVKAHSRDVELK